MSLAATISVVVFGFVLLATVCARVSSWLAHWLSARGVLDHPNARSLHARPTPRGGGLVVVAAVIASLPPAVLFLGLALSHAVALLLLVGGSSLLGWLDDRHGLAARLRLTVQLILAILILWPLGILPQPAQGELEAWLLAVAVIAGCVWLTNLYNFMDGADGLAGTQGAGAGVAAALLLWQVGAPGLALVAGALAAGSLGFLWVNWPPARLFMGDVGSYCLGSAWAGLALIAALTTPLPLALWLVLLAPFVLDATLTLVTRVLRGHSPFQAHRGHTYQRLLLAGVSLRVLLTGFIGVQLAVLWPTAWWMAAHPADAPLAGMAVLSGGVLVWLGLRWHAARCGTSPIGPERDPGGA
ncbi:MAG TPA: hypothetical protein DCY89_07635 [Gammaproteobacteria bacterium]|nr:hypothetical protein [Gammaproteobacteria bacterium]